MRMQRLKTFSTISTKTSRMKRQDVVLKADRNFFSQMILVAESRSVHMKDVLVPSHWAHCYGHWQMQMSPYEKQTRPHLSGSLRKMYLLQKVSQLHQPVSLMGWVWYKGWMATTKHLHKLLSLSCQWYCMWLDRILSLTYTTSRPSNIMKD